MDQESLQLLVSRTMPYGKYKGRLIADLPGNSCELEVGAQAMFNSL